MSVSLSLRCIHPYSKDLDTKIVLVLSTNHLQLSIQFCSGPIFSLVLTTGSELKHKPASYGLQPVRWLSCFACGSVGFL